MVDRLLRCSSKAIGVSRLGSHSALQNAPTGISLWCTTLLHAYSKMILSSEAAQDNNTPVRFQRVDFLIRCWPDGVTLHHDFHIIDGCGGCGQVLRGRVPAWGSVDLSVKMT